MDCSICEKEIKPSSIHIYIGEQQICNPCFHLGGNTSDLIEPDDGKDDGRD